MHEEFLCHVTAYGVSGGVRVGVPLGVYRAPSLPQAVTWLRERAEWLAALLDPHPESAWLPPGTVIEAARRVWEVPDALRAWSADIDRHLRLAEELLAGELVEVRWHDESTEYELLAESVDAARMRRVNPPQVPAEAQGGAREESVVESTLALPLVHRRREDAAEQEEYATLQFAAVHLEARSRGPNSYFGLRVPSQPHSEPASAARREGGVRLRDRLTRKRA